ncbi:hypothetical protein ACVW00_002198 [Marmoricola sp. URHA0025 HA25]
MNTTLRNLIVALPLATAALAMTPGVAQADNGPVIVLPPPSGDPQGPVIANPTPGHDPVGPTGPGDLTAPQPCPTHGVCGGNGGGSGQQGGTGDNAGDHTKGHQGHHAQPGNHAVSSIALPTRIDAGLAPAAHHEHSGLELSWVLAGGALVTATGAAFAARRRGQASA